MTSEGRRAEGEGRRVTSEERRETSEGRRAEGEGRRETSEGRRAEGEGRRAKGEERRAMGEELREKVDERRSADGGRLVRGRSCIAGGPGIGTVIGRVVRSVMRTGCGEGRLSTGTGSIVTVGSGEGTSGVAWRGLRTGKEGRSRGTRSRGWQCNGLALGAGGGCVCADACFITVGEPFVLINVFCYMLCHAAS